MEITEVTTGDDFYAMKDEWNALVDKCANSLLYSRQEWLWAWWRYYGQPMGVPLHIICLRANGELKGLFPFTVSTISVKGILHFRFLHFIGQNVSAYQDAVLAKGWEKKTLRGVMAYLEDAHPLCSMIYLPKLHPDSVLSSRQLAKECHGWWLGKALGQSISPFIVLPSEWTELEQGLTKNARSQIRRGEKRLSKLGPVSLTIHEGGSSNETSIAEFFHYHEAKWGLEELLRIGYQAYKPFVTEAFQASLVAGIGRYVTLHIRDQWVAGQLCFDHSATRYSQMVAFNPEFRDCDPGNVLNALTIQEAIERRMHIFSFGQGTHGTREYKYRFAAHELATNSLILSKQALRGKLLAWCERIGRSPRPL